LLKIFTKLFELKTCSNYRKANYSLCTSSYISCYFDIASHESEATSIKDNFRNRVLLIINLIMEFIQY